MLATLSRPFVNPHRLSKVALWIVAIACGAVSFWTKEPFLTAAGQVSGLIALYVLFYLPSEVGGRTLWYAGSFGIALAGTALFTFAQSPLQLFAGWELVSVAGWSLIAFGKGISRRSTEAAFIAFTVNRLADVFWIAGLFSEGAYPTGIWIGLLVKAGIFPFSFWLVQAMYAAPPVSALLHSVVIVGMGTYLPIRYPELVGGHTLPFYGKAVLYVSAVFASLGSLLSRNSKAILAWTTATHLALVLFSLEVPSVALRYLLHHSYLKAALFLLLGLAQKMGGFTQFTTGLWIFLCLLLTGGGGLSEPTVMFIELLTAAALGRAWGRASHDLKDFWGVSSGQLVPLTVILVLGGIDAIRLAEWRIESFLFLLPLFMGMLYRRALHWRIDRVFLRLVTQLLRGWYVVSRAACAMERGLYYSLSALARSAVRVGTTFRSGEAILSGRGWRTSASSMRKFLAALTGEQQSLLYTQAMRWGFILSLILILLWKVSS